MRRKSLNNVSYLLIYVESYLGISFYITFIYLITNADNFERKSGEKRQSKIDLKELKMIRTCDCATLYTAGKRELLHRIAYD